MKLPFRASLEDPSRAIQHTCFTVTGQFRVSCNVLVSARTGEGKLKESEVSFIHEYSVRILFMLNL